MANYTMTYQEYVKRYGAPTSLSQVIPDITIGGKTYFFATMFEARHRHHEICCETATLFEEVANRFLGELGLIFRKKIQDWESHLDDIWQREEISEDKTVDNYYFNPTVSVTGENAPKLQSTSEHKFPHRIVYNTKDTAALLKANAEIENLLYEALRYSDNLFMSIY